MIQPPEEPREQRLGGVQGRGFKGEVKEDDNYLKCEHLKIRTNRQTDRPIDKQTFWFIGKLHFQKIKDSRVVLSDLQIFEILKDFQYKSSEISIYVTHA